MINMKTLRPLKLALVTAGAICILSLALLPRDAVTTYPAQPAQDSGGIEAQLQGLEEAVMPPHAADETFPKEFMLLDLFYQAISTNRALTASQFKEKMATVFKQSGVTLLALGEYHDNRLHQKFGTELINSFIKQNGTANLFIERIGWPTLCTQEECGPFLYEIPNVSGIKIVGIGDLFEKGNKAEQTTISMAALGQRLEGGKLTVTYTGTGHVHTDGLKFYSGGTVEYSGRELKFGLDGADQLIISSVAEKANSKGIYVMMHNLKDLLGIADEAFVGLLAAPPNLQNPETMRNSLDKYASERQRLANGLNRMAPAFVYVPDKPNVFYGLVNNSLMDLEREVPILRSLEGMLEDSGTVKVLAEQGLSFAKFVARIEFYPGNTFGEYSYSMVFQKGPAFQKADGYVSIKLGTDYKVKEVTQIKRLPTF